jgi:hypothetical protein
MPEGGLNASADLKSPSRRGYRFSSIAVAGHDGIRAAASASKRLCASQKGRRQVATKVGLTPAAPPGATPFSLLAVYRASSRIPDRSRSARLPVLSPSIRAFPGGSEAWSPSSSPSLSGRIRHSPAPSGRRTVTQGSLATPSWRPPNALVGGFPSRQERWPAFLATLKWPAAGGLCLGVLSSRRSLGRARIGRVVLLGGREGWRRCRSGR